MKLSHRFGGALLLALSFAAPASADQSNLYSDPTIATSGLSLMNAYNSAFLATASCNSGASAPANLQAGNVAGVCWADTSLSGFIKMKRYDGANWVEQYRLDTTNHVVLAPLGTGIGTLTAASTTDLCAVPQSSITITGTGTITSFGSSCLQPGAFKLLTFAGLAAITYNSSTMILPGGGSISVVVGDTALAQYRGGSSWTIVSYNPISGSALKNPAVPVCTKIDYMGFAANLPSTFMLALGQAISRATYPDYLACVTTVMSGTLTNGSLVIAGLASTAELSAGMPVENAFIPAGAIIASINSSSQITLNAGHAATANGSNALTFFAYGYGAGGSSTTVGLPDCAGRATAGRDPSASRISAFSGLWSTKGSELHTMTISEMVAHSHGINDPGHSHGITDPGHSHTVSGGIFGGSGSLSGVGTGATIAITGATHVTIDSAFTGISVNSAFTGISTTVSVGGTTPFTVLDPVISANCAMRVLP